MTQAIYGCKECGNELTTRQIRDSNIYCSNKCSRTSSRRVALEDDGHWDCTHFNHNDYIGFTYLITNTLSGVKYYGKKRLWAYTKGKITTIAKDWKNYTGSCDRLNADIERLGKQYFTFEIESLHTTLSSLNYRELWLIVTNDCVLTEKYYNRSVPSARCIPKDYDKKIIQLAETHRSLVGKEIALK